MAVALDSGKADPERIVKAFLQYMEHDDHKITRAVFEENFAKKTKDPGFLSDVAPLLSSGFAWDDAAAGPAVKKAFIERLPGEPWKGVKVRPSI